MNDGVEPGELPGKAGRFVRPGNADWLVATMRPGSQTMRNLAAALLASDAIETVTSLPMI